jgi:ankyrin repeat protein
VWGQEKIIQVLLDHGANINAEGDDGNALEAASMRGHEKTVQLLLDNGADVNA